MQLAEVRKSGKLTYLRPDGKTQVTAEFDDDGNPMRIDTILISAQHDPDVSIETMKKDPPAVGLGVVQGFSGWWYASTRGAPAANSDAGVSGRRVRR